MDAVEGPDGLPWVARQRPRTKAGHETHMAELQSEEGQITQTLCISSSMMERFLNTGRQFTQWREKYRVVLAAVGGDGIEHMLYRVDNGLVDACPATLRTVVIMAGSNNIETRSPLNVFRGVKTLIAAVRGRRPNVAILLYGLIPRVSERMPFAVLQARIDELNALLATLDQPGEYPIVYRYFGGAFLAWNGQRRNEYFDDDKHLNRDGYAIFARQLDIDLSELTGTRTPSPPPTPNQPPAQRTPPRRTRRPRLQ